LAGREHAFPIAGESLLWDRWRNLANMENMRFDPCIISTREQDVSITTKRTHKAAQAAQIPIKAMPYFRLRRRNGTE
jgi:hypothetical protein